MDADVRAEIEALKGATVRELKARYRELFGEASPSSNHAHLWRRIAWRLQARRQGVLSDRARSRALELASDTDLRLRAPRYFWQELIRGGKESAVPARDTRLPAAGTVLERVYGDRTIRVTVLAHGFECEAQRYQSLSAVAYAVTGTRWNGFAFFGLNGGRP